MIYLITIICLFSANLFAQDDFKLTYYQQTVSVLKNHNYITQSQLKFINLQEELEYYAGVALDLDTKSDSQATYSDQQVTPLIGLQSKVKFSSRFFLEYRDVNRVGEFVDNRSKKTNEIRVGLFGYKKLDTARFFHEFYYASFYTSLYNDQIILQTFYKHGFNYRNFDFFNEILVDSFDLTKSEQFTVDARPGVRYNFKLEKGIIQLLAQHLIPIDRSGRENEDRLTLVLYFEI